MATTLEGLQAAAKKARLLTPDGKLRETLVAQGSKALMDLGEECHERVVVL